MSKQSHGATSWAERLLIGLSDFTQCPQCCFCGRGDMARVPERVSGEQALSHSSWTQFTSRRAQRGRALPHLVFTPAVPASPFALCTSFSLLCPLHSLFWGSPYHRGASQCSLLTQQKCPLFSYCPPRLVFCHFTKLGYCIEMPELNSEEQWQSVVGEKKWQVTSSYSAVMSS